MPAPHTTATAHDEARTFAHVRAAEKAADEQRAALAAKTVAEYSRDAAECSALLDMLGLDVADLR
ncbi:hypothetical protein AB0H71_06685 [Nocardia sp. NPDC050697]|uniref:hypothetical protein n=1 Tax=Nocardia sp. NPDC050697 TaxID=3155158 RepID=UPI0033FC11F0